MDHSRSVYEKFAGVFREGGNDAGEGGKRSSTRISRSNLMASETWSKLVISTFVPIVTYVFLAFHLASHSFTLRVSCACSI
ncbi:hypothetical protein AB6A40_004747 [Gnathostoma spinigerum]|uniref:Uncharacterized protein n=1 Tax=Gnathostoma spinigerum TaxID=75299 RepID=A0ABD6EDF2_9BILA